MSRADPDGRLIRPPGFRGAAFSTAAAGDARGDARGTVAAALGIDQRWATVRQVHGSEAVQVAQAGSAGEADALFTDRPHLPVAVFTADCAGVVIEAAGAVGVVHAGWRGVAQGAVTSLLEVMLSAGHPPRRAAIGPTIGPCCFEVGPEVAGAFPGFERRTTWDTRSVDLPVAIQAQLAGLEVWSAGECTRCSERFHSHRRDQTPQRMAAIGWLV